VVTPNKKASTLELPFYQSLKRASQESSGRFLYETTVGAGLPVINTLRELHRTGDRIHSIEGVLSGTLSFIFNSVTPDRPFSSIVREAKDLGYTEPDPRDDLSGQDVARKLTILAREIGLPLELSDVRIEALLPKELGAGTVDDFMRRLPEVDAAMRARLEEAAAGGQVLRFVGAIDEAGKASVSLRPYPASHAFARIEGTDNIVAFRTARYSARPLIVQGPGAGRDVTAAGVFADLLRLSSYLGAPT
jgi:aspartokinase/homoserine dehydrogenase 1